VVWSSEFLTTDTEVRVWFPALPDFLRSSGCGMGSTRPREYNWGATGKKSSGSGLESLGYDRWHQLRLQAAVARSVLLARGLKPRSLLSFYLFNHRVTAQPMLHNMANAAKPSNCACQGTFWPPSTDMQVHCCAEGTSCYGLNTKTIMQPANLSFLLCCLIMRFFKHS
jgi:hypothetical protein